MASINSLSDSFNAITFNANWTTAVSGSGSAGDVTLTNGVVQILGHTTTWQSSLASVAAYDLTGQSAWVQVVDPGDQSIVSHEAGLQMVLDSSNLIWLFIGDGVIKAFKMVAGVQTQVGSSITYMTGVHKWLRLRESGGTIFYEWSDNVTWTNPAGWSVANPFAVTSLTAQIYAREWQNETNGSYAYFKNFNIRLSTQSPYRHVEVSDGMSRSEVAN